MPNTRTSCTLTHRVVAKTQPTSREAAAALGRHIVDSLLTLDPKAKIIYMGDLNDDPTNASVKKVMRAKGDIDSLQDADMFNPFYPLYQKGIGSLAYRDSWNLFDQHLISQSLLEKDLPHSDSLSICI